MQQCILKMKKNNPLWKERYKTVKQDHLTVRHTTTECGNSFYGIIVKKKVGNAVMRNRIKRRLRSAFQAKNITPHKSYIAIVQKASILDMPFNVLVQSIESIA